MTPQIIDLTAQAPAEYRVRTRPASEVRAIVLHQTGFAWKQDNPRWPLVKAHFAVRQDGSVPRERGVSRARRGGHGTHVAARGAVPVAPGGRRGPTGE